MTFTLRPLPTPPSDEEMKALTLPNWKRVEPTLLSGLHPKLLQLTIPTLFFSIPMTEVDPDWLNCFDGKTSHDVVQRIIDCGREALKHFPDGVFFKLDSRSPKDWGIVRYTESNIDELPSQIFSSERMLDDLCMQRHHQDAIVICFRKWVEMGEEYRVFVKDRKIQGISRYDYHEPTKSEQTAKLQAVIKARAALYLAAVNPFFPLDDYVFDLGQDGLILIEALPQKCHLPLNSTVCLKMPKWQGKVWSDGEICGQVSGSFTSQGRDNARRLRPGRHAASPS